jgi:ubiquitin-conjugating enzyme E2 Z
MNKVTIRVMNDYVDFNKIKPDGIYLWIDKTNIFQQYALIIGPENTPYFGGFYFFNIKYPDNYPEKPPEVKLMTTNGKVRFNPNLYQCGKVCLSILGTWAGPAWKPIMNIRLVLNSIRSLMGEYPIQNEPGFEKTQPEQLSSIEYNLYLIYHNYEIAIIDVLANKYSNISKLFENEIKEEFKKNLTKLSNDLLSYQQIHGKVPVTKQIYFMEDKMLNFNTLVDKFNKVKNKFD